jgi:regulatory protein YycI of two-component signal transduction system YycFG
VRKDLSEVKESADILVKVARNDDGATSIRLGLQSLDQLGKLDSECKKMKERLDASLNECCKNMNEAKNDIGELKFITKTLMKEAEWTISGHRPRAETIAEIGECIDKIRIVYSGASAVKESVDNKWRVYEQSMIDTKNDIIASRKEISDVKDAIEELVCAKHVRAVNDTKSIRVGEQNLLELKKLSSCKRDIKRFIDNKLNTYNQDMMSTKI